MKKNWYCLLVTLLIGQDLAYGQNYEWAKPIIGKGNSINFLLPTHTTLDSKGNIIVLGEINSRDSFVTIGNDTVNMIGNFGNHVETYFPIGFWFNDLYLAKFDTSGNLMWSVNPWPIDFSLFNADLERFTEDLFEIQIDVQNNMYLGGYSIYSGNFYVAKYSPGGNLLWCKCIVKELEANTDSINWDPGINTMIYQNKAYSKLSTPIQTYHNLFYHIENNGNIVLSGAGYHDSVLIGNKTIKNYRSVFLAETDSNGNLIWEQQPYTLDFCALDSVKINTYAPCLISDKGSGFYLIGIYTKGIEQQGNQLTNPDGCNLAYFASRYDSSGKLTWTKPLGIFNPNPGGYSLFNQGPSVPEELTILPANNPYFSTATDSTHHLYMFLVSPDSLSYDTFKVKSQPISNRYLYLLKYNMEGQKQWLKQISVISKSSSYDSTSITDLYVSSFGYVYATFTVDTNQNGQVSFVIDNQTFNFNHKNSFLACFNNMGKLVFIKGFKSDVQSLVLTANNNGDVFLSGSISLADGKMDFDSLSISGNGMWIAKLHYPAPLLPDSVWYVTHGCNDSVNFFVTYDIKPDSILWQFGDGSTSSSLQPSHKYGAPGTYKAILHFYFRGQDDTTSMVVNTYGPALAELSGNKSVCDTSTVLNAGQAAGEIYLWSTGDTNSAITVTASGKYWVTATLNGCTASDTTNITLLKPIAFENDNIKNAVFCDQDTTLVLDAGIAYKYLWSPNGDTTEKVNITASGVYFVTISGTDGCTASKSDTVSDQCPCYLYIPNIFTPNQDHINDIFYAQSACQPITYTLQVYNRWGERVFQSNDINTGWDGTFKNLTCPEGVYVYKIIYKFPNATEQIKSGTVTVGR